MRGIIVFAAALAVSCGAAAAPPKKKGAPAAEPAMQVYVVRSAHAGCEPQCPQWIAAQGRITPGTAEKFRKVLRDLGDRKLPIFIDSLGGSIVDALAIEPPASGPIPELPGTLHDVCVKLGRCNQDGTPKESDIVDVPDLLRRESK